MNSRRTFGLAALAALAVMASMGASTAMATGNTALCKIHEDPCQVANQVSQVHAVSTNFVVLNNIANVLCLEVLTKLNALKLGNPLVMHSEALVFTGCGTNAAHNNCSITTEELPLLNVLRTSLNLAEATFQAGRIRVQCTVLGSLVIDCPIELAGTELVMWGSGHLPGFGDEGGQSGSGAGTTPSGFDDVLCPEEIETDILLTALEHFYIVS
jgi:hypothetical protein